MATIHFVDATALARCGLHGEADDCAALQRQLSLRQGLPFFLDEVGRPLLYANRWLAGLPTDGCPSPRTWEAYARDFHHWYEFLRQRDSDPLSATREHVSDYYTLLRVESDRPIARSSWNRRIAALDKFYDWAVEDGLIRRAPFTYRWANFIAGDGRPISMNRNQARERTGRATASFTWLEEDYGRVFLDVGLNGLSSDGTTDTSFSGRNAARNLAFGELLLGAGLRAAEASHLLTFELPQAPEGEVPFVVMQLPAPITKGNKGRSVWVPPGALRKVHSYATMERELARPKWQPARPLRVEEADRDGGLVDGQRVRWANLSVEQRRRLITADGCSPLLFLVSSARNTGGPMVRWDGVFAAATERCRAVDSYFPKVTPHVLRHSFAMAMLRTLIKMVGQRIEKLQLWSGAEELAGYWRLHDPLITLRDLLGHSSVVTTQIYLRGLDPTRFMAKELEETLSDGELAEAREEELVA